MTRRADVSVCRRRDGYLICSSLKSEKVDALVLIKRVRHRPQPDPAHLAYLIRRGSRNHKGRPVGNRGRGLGDDGPRSLEQVGWRKELAVSMSVDRRIRNIDPDGWSVFPTATAEDASVGQ